MRTSSATRPPIIRLSLLIAACVCVLQGCSKSSASSAYLQGLEQRAIAGDLARAGNVDLAVECPACNADEIAFAQNVVAAEKGMARGCAGLPAAESSYRNVARLADPVTLPTSPEYQEFVGQQTCEAAGRYERCTEPANRRISISDASGPAGALIEAIDSCRKYNPAAAEDIVNLAIAHEAQAITEDLMAAKYDRAKPELRIYDALPRSNKERVAQWRMALSQRPDQSHDELRLVDPKEAAEARRND